MKGELGNTIKRFLLWCFLFFVPMVIGYVVGSSLSIDAVMSWSVLLGSMLVVFIFLGKRYVQLTLGRIEKRGIWFVTGISVLVAVAGLLALMSGNVLFGVGRMEDGVPMNNESGRYFGGVAGVLFGSLFGPVAEEIGFRGVLLGGLLKTRSRPWLAILISALVFASFHGFEFFVSAMLFGIIVGWLYYRTGSLIPGIITHVVNNSLSFIDLSGQSHATVMVIFVGSLLLLVLGLWQFGKKFGFVSDPEIYTG